MKTMTEPDDLHLAHNTVAARIHDKATLDALRLMVRQIDDGDVAFDGYGAPYVDGRASD